MIKFIYLDVGGVAILDFSGTNKWEELKKQIGINPEHYEYFDIFWDKHEDINTTRDIETLKPLIEKEFGVKFPKDYSLLLDGFVKHFKINKSLWPVVNKIQNESKIGLLTNMYPNMLNAIQDEGVMPFLKWDTIVDSSVVGLEKPNIEIYKLAQEKSNVEGREILFVDNLQRNIDPVKSLGWNTFLYDPINPEKSSRELLTFFEKNK